MKTLPITTKISLFIITAFLLLWFVNNSPLAQTSPENTRFNVKREMVNSRQTNAQTDLSRPSRAVPQQDNDTNRDILQVQQMLLTRSQNITNMVQRKADSLLNIAMRLEERITLLESENNSLNLEQAKVSLNSAKSLIKTAQSQAQLLSIDTNFTTVEELKSSASVFKADVDEVISTLKQVHRLLHDAVSSVKNQ